VSERASDGGMVSWAAVQHVERGVRSELVGGAAAGGCGRGLAGSCRGGGGRIRNPEQERLSGGYECCGDGRSEHEPAGVCSVAGVAAAARAH
jgi:hypothetical protein